MPNRNQILELQLDDVFTADGVPLRLVTRLEFHKSNARGPSERLTGLMEIAVRQSVAMKTLEKLENSKGRIDPVAAQVLRDDALELGAKVIDVSIVEMLSPVAAGL